MIGYDRSLMLLQNLSQTIQFEDTPLNSTIALLKIKINIINYVKSYKVIVMVGGGGRGRWCRLVDSLPSI